MEPLSFDLFKSSITNKTKCVLFAYLFGVKYDLSKYIEHLNEKHIDIIEDVAQSFKGPERFNGTPGVTMSMFSLGNIKT